MKNLINASPVRLDGALDTNRSKASRAGQDRRLSFLSPHVCAGLAPRTPGEAVGLITLRLSESYTLIGVLGEEAAFRILEGALEMARELFPLHFPLAEILREERLGFGEYALFFRLPGGRDEGLFARYAAFRFSLLDQAASRACALTEYPVGLHVGYALLDQAAGLDMEAQVFRAYCAGQRLARARIDPHWVAMREELSDIVAHGRVSMVYQPVVNFRTGGILGWEALARGPQDSLLHAPAHLFGFAQEVGSAPAVDRMCIKAALAGLSGLDGERQGFLNIHPRSLNGSGATLETLSDAVRAAGLRPGNLVLELPENGVSPDINLFLKNIEPYRAEGFALAIDDVGAASSSLRILSLIQPEFIKVDASLVSKVDSNPFKRVMLESLALLSEKLGCRLIAEGVETDTEFSSLVSMGVHAGQGFFLGCPAPEPECPDILLPARVGTQAARENVWNCSIPVRELVETAFSVDTSLSIHEVKELLKDKPPLSSVVVVDGDRPAGLIMNYNLDRHLSTMYGVSLYYNRDVTRLMDCSPLVADADWSVEDVAKRAMGRESHKIYDDIIVAGEEGRLLGIVSVQRMLDTLAKVHMELAKGSNPLTGLPGNVSIEMAIAARSGSRIPCSIIYVDLDNFKVYNDVYGFANGDKVILLTARALREAAQNPGGEDPFVGHVGGDDFVVITEPGRVEAICQAVIRDFGREVGRLYTEADRQAGFITAKGRDGREARFPLVSISMGVVDCAFQYPFTHEEMGRRTAEMKKLAKARPGNSYVRDRRAPLGSRPPEAETAPGPEQPRLTLVQGTGTAPSG